MPLENARVNVEDRGFQFSDSIYEVIACYDGVFLDLAAHLKRLAASCAAIYLPLPCSIDRMEALIRETYKRNHVIHASIYIQISRGTAPRSLNIPDGIDPTLIITCRELPFPPELAPVFSAITLQDFRWARCDIKSTALIASVMGRHQAVQNGADEAFWSDDKGHVLEGTASNVLAIIDDTLVTHPLDEHVLGGITREMTIQIARETGIHVAERPWRLSEPKLSECMLTSTLYAIAPVCRVDGQRIGTGAPGAATLHLRKCMIDSLRSLNDGNVA